MRIAILAVPALLALALPQRSVAAPPDPTLSGHTRSTYRQLEEIILRAAERMPAASYGFQPVPGVRTFGQILGHIADAQYLFCATAQGDKPPVLNVEQTRSTKADLAAALRSAFAYCGRAYGALTDANALQTRKLFGDDTPRLAVLAVNNTHCAEHYGNLVVYLRLNHLQPPTSDPGARITALGSIVPGAPPRR